jgi:tRNA pseudouridine55 synthase
LTSHDVVARARRLLGERRIGHAGTLDPDATGVLVLGIGPATRLLRFTGDLVKSYVGEVVLGVETSTLDASGEVTAEHDMSAVTVQEAAAAATRLTGRIAQVPPMVSALHAGGRRLHELARQGITVERAAREIEVYAFEVSPGSAPGCLAIAVDCSSGTYVRSLAADLGALLGGGAHLRSLRRTAVGAFGGHGLVALDALAPEHVGPPELLVAHLPRVVVDETVAVAVGHGKVLDRSELGVAEGSDSARSASGPWAVFSAEATLLAVYEAQEARRVKPLLVLAAAQ